MIGFETEWGGMMNDDSDRPRKCSECGSTDLQYYDDGEGYAPNIKCRSCGHWD